MAHTATSFTHLPLQGRAQQLPITRGEDSAFRLEFEADVGLYQISVLADAAEFDWEELYLELNQFGNQNARTGPWDFDLLNKNRPLVPSYWVRLDGEPIGLWFFQRVSLEDIAAKQFRGRAAFWMKEPGKHVLELTPYRPIQLTWIAATLEPDPEDSLAEIRWEDLDLQALSARSWADPEFWEEQRRRLASSHAAYEGPLRRAFDWVMQTWSENPAMIPLLVAAAEIGGREEARAKAFEILDATIAKPHWSNPNPEGYSNNGDMGAAYALRALAWCYHALQGQLGDEREAALLAKLRLQGDRFHKLTLLNRDYWGGSVMQDHGRVSLPAFANAAIHLLGILPEARDWLAFALPRTRRSTAAMPRDGVLPQSSYCNLFLYLDETSLFRDSLLEISGEDLFNEGPFWEILDYLQAVVRAEDHCMIVGGNAGDRMPLLGGNLFLNRLATKYGDDRAAYFQDHILRTPEIIFTHPTIEHAYYLGALWGFLSYSPHVAIPEALPSSVSPLRHFADSGFIHYQDPDCDLVLTARCGPWIGYHAYRHARGPCDRMEMAPGKGHFIVAVGGNIRLASPEAGYSLRTELCTTLLVDGQGQYGDVGYPMSIPSKVHRGEEIESVHWDENSRRGRAILDLGPAYPEELGVLVYKREFLPRAGGTIVCRDRVVLKKPRRLNWLFQTTEAIGVELVDSDEVRFGQADALLLTARSPNVSLCASIQPTRVVWSYSSASNFKPFQHVRFDSTEPVACATVEFVLKASP